MVLNQEIAYGPIVYLVNLMIVLICQVSDTTKVKWKYKNVGLTRFYSRSSLRLAVFENASNFLNIGHYLDGTNGGFQKGVFNYIRLKLIKFCKCRVSWKLFLG